MKKIINFHITKHDVSIKTTPNLIIRSDLGNKDNLNQKQRAAS